MIATYWHNLNERERWMVSIGLLCILLYLFYQVIYSPLAGAISTKSKQLIEKEETLAWMQQVQPHLKNQKNAQIITKTKLLALISNQLSSNSFRQFAYQLQQTGAGDIQLSFDRVPYNQLLSWLWTLNNNYVVSLQQFTAERTDTLGIVKLLLVITIKSG